MKIEVIDSLRWLTSNLLQPVHIDRR